MELLGGNLQILGITTVKLNCGKIKCESDKFRQLNQICDATIFSKYNGYAYI